MSRITVRLSDDRKEQFKAQAQSRGKNMSEVVNEFIDDFLSDDGSGKLPDDERLATAYKTIVDQKAGHRVRASHVIPVIADYTNLSKNTVKSLLDRLQMHNYIKVQGSFLYPQVEIPTTTPEPVRPEDLHDWDRDETLDDAEPITNDDDDPITDEAGIESDDDHVLGFDVTVETDPDPDTDETDDGEIVSDGGIRLVDYYRGLYQLRNGQPIPVDEIDLIDAKLNEIEDQGWINIESETIYCQIVPQDQVKIDDRNYDTLGDKKREHFRREGMSYDSYLRNEKNLSPDPTRLVIDQTADDAEATNEETTAV